ncbi:Urmylation protein [Serendipita sp. 399]|nr:Urmylation protein [Serendipita sp. 399]
MILDGFGLDAQLKLKDARVLVVGAGGLGCPALQYLAAVGVGKLLGLIGIVDHDKVELSNLHRQVLHTEKRIGLFKVDSAALALREMNSLIEIETHKTLLHSENAREIVSRYDIVLDCTDNAPTRYLLSDTTVALGKPLVSGAAMRYEGQLCTYNLRPDGPCYRCIFPKPPTPNLVGTCEETGVLGAVCGVIGNLQALEAIKLITGQHDGTPSLLLFSALGLPPFRTVKIRSKRPQCPACGAGIDGGPKIEETDYVAFCGGSPTDWEAARMVSGENTVRKKPIEIKEVLAAAESTPWTVLDVRSPAEFSICHLDDSINVPLSELVHDPKSHIPPEGSVVVVCRLGNDSQIAAKALQELLGVNGMKGRAIVDMIGGLRAWSRDVDPNFPVY